MLRKGMVIGMWKGYYGKEPFNLRLTVLRMAYQLPLIAAVTVLGTAVFGGGYYVKNVLLRDRSLYAAKSFYRIEYTVDNVEDIINVYINEASWNTYLQSRMFLDAVQGNLAQSGADPVSDEELAGAIKAEVLSDLRVPSTTVISDSPEKSVAIAQAVEAAMTQEMPEKLSEITSMEIIDPGDEAEEVIPDVRVGRALILSAVLSCFFVVLALLLKETGDDSIWLPGSVWRRYGVKTVGTVESRELAQQMGYFFRREKGSSQGLGKVAVCAVQEDVDPEAVLARLREACPDIVDDAWIGVPSPLGRPENCRLLRETEGILLAVKAGSHAGRALERTLELLMQQDCPVTAALLWEADEKLIRRYDWCGGKVAARDRGKRAGGGRA